MTYELQTELEKLPPWMRNIYFRLDPDTRDAFNASFFAGMSGLVQNAA